MNIRLLLSCSLIGLSIGAAKTKAATLTDDWNVWNDAYVNELMNVRYGSVNPTQLSYNVKQTSGVAILDYSLGRGLYHSVDKSGHVNDLNVFIGGLKDLGKLDLSGYLKYTNRQENSKVWNSSLYLNQDNPFVLCDSVPSDVTTESFEMGTAASYAFSNTMKGALSLNLKTGNMSDQTDPRPETKSSDIQIKAGSEWKIGRMYFLGLSAGIDMYGSDISYTVVNPLNNHRFFLMKGMGDYFRRSSSDESGYSREYKGDTYSCAAQITYAPETSKWKNFFEVMAEKGNEDAEDGGSAYTFKGGDYDFNSFSFRNRLEFIPNDKIIHHLVFSGTINNGDGTWYDQKKEVDTEHGNISYYKILSKNKIHKSKRVSLNLEYRLNTIYKSCPDFYFYGNVGIEQVELKHFNDDGMHQQKSSLAHLKISAGKNFFLNKGSVSTSIHGGYYIPITNRIYGTGTSLTGDGDITAVYVNPEFEYVTSRYYNLGGSVKYDIPMRSGKDVLLVGVFAKVDSNIYQDDGTYYFPFKSKKYTTTNIGVVLSF
jgi:hypothetical protein